MPTFQYEAMDHTGREVKDAMAYVKAVINPTDEVAVKRVLNTPKRGIGDRAVACVNALIGLRQRLPQSLSQISERTDGRIGAGRTSGLK